MKLGPPGISFNKGSLAVTCYTRQSPLPPREGPQYLDGYETQEAAGFREQGSEVIRVDNQHLCGEDLGRISQKRSSQQATSLLQGTRQTPPAHCPLLARTLQWGMWLRTAGSPNVESRNLKPCNFKGERDLRGLMLPSILRRSLCSCPDLNLLQGQHLHVGNRE